MCYTDEDDELWQEDPYEFIRVKYGKHNFSVFIDINFMKNYVHKLCSLIYIVRTVTMTAGWLPEESTIENCLSKEALEMLNPLTPNIKEKILLSCPHAFVIKVLGEVIKISGVQ